MNTRITTCVAVLVLLQATALAVAAEETVKIVMLGDSITRGVRSGVTVEETFAALVDRQMNSQGVPCSIVNVGIGGERTDQALRRLESDVLALQPDWVVVMYGTNDSYVDAGKKESRITATDYENNLREIVARLRSKNIRPLLMTEPRWGDDANPNGVGEHPNLRLEHFVEKCRLVAKDLEVPLVDNYSAWSRRRELGQDLGEWTTDQCHPNGQGHQVIAECLLAVLMEQCRADSRGPLNYDIQLDTINSGYDGKTCWVHPRLGTIPGRSPIVVLTMQKLLLTGSDVFYALNEMRTEDLGQTWLGPSKHDTLGRREEAGGLEAVVCDFTPAWHAKSGKLLGTGHVARYDGDKLANDYARQTAYSVYDPQQQSWTSWRCVVMPDSMRFYNSGAGCTQRLDLPNGDILLPIYNRAKGEKRYTSMVTRCRFAGETLSCIEYGAEIAIDIDRGFVEPSLTQFQGRFYLTLRNDQAGYVTSSDDGLHYDPPRRWSFDDGEDLGNYNTQQHWVTHSDGLFLVYNRRGANNDHVFRHRAPLFIAQVDPQSMRIVRSTERVLVPQRGARLGNFAVSHVTPDETWVSVAEWMQRKGPDFIIPVDNMYGANNSVYIARIKWSKPNHMVYGAP